MPKTRELSNDERLAIKYLRESGLSFRKIGEQLNCHHSTALTIYNRFVSSGSVAKKARSGRPSKINERGERIVCRAAKNLGLELQKKLLKKFANPMLAKLHPNILLEKYCINISF